MNINEQETKDMLQLENLFYELQDNYYKLAVYITNEYKTKDGELIRLMRNTTTIHEDIGQVLFEHDVQRRRRQKENTDESH